MTNLLWISYCAPYKQVAHAGGKNHYYWLKKIDEDGDFEINLITCCESSEVEAIRSMKYSFPHFCCVGSNSKGRRIWQKLQSVVFAPGFVFRFAGSVAVYKIRYVKKTVRMLKEQGYVPDTVMLHWTQMGLLYDWIRRMFPEAKLVVMEEDVSFLRTRREYEGAKGVAKILKKLLHHVMYTRELKMCHNADGIVVTNQKDAAILTDHGIEQEKIIHTVSYYQNMSMLKPIADSKKLLFYGAMNRKENVDAVIWFAETVMPRLREQDAFELVILGGNPVPAVKALANDYISVTGFVEDVRPYFEQSLCFVAPLFSGAGIKIKVLEAMSSGIPVLTNGIGIEGIMAENGREYCHCETAEDYVTTILKLSKGLKMRESIGGDGRRLVLKEFNAEESVVQFKELLKACE